MAASFPLTPAPSYYARCDFPTTARNGVFYVGGVAPSAILSQSGATGYYVLNYDGAQVSSGAFSGTTCTPTAPAGGWAPGWYRIYFTGTSTDSVFGASYGATNFTIIRNHPNLPPMPAGPVTGGGDARDVVMRAVMGMGAPRLSMYSLTNLGPDLPGIQIDVGLVKTYWSAPDSQFADPARPARRPWVGFAGSTYDQLLIPGATGGGWLRVYPKDESVDGSRVYITVGAGSTTGSKLMVCSPDSSTVVETYDNLADAATAAAVINAASARIKVFTSSQSQPSTVLATAIGRTYWNALVGVVQALYPDVPCYEGPLNEPTLGPETAHQMRLFAAAVHAGNANAKALGPCPVEITQNLTAWKAFFDAGGASYCDEISFHAYNSDTLGDINMGRSTIEAFTALLASYGLSGKTLWDTESNNVLTPVYGVYHPRRSRVALLYTLMWEQYGLPRERNQYWYDQSHGFWSFPAWLENTDNSLNPMCGMFRTLAEETFGQTHSTRLRFGAVGDRIFLGSVYAGANSSTAVLVTTSALPGATVTLTLTGAAGSLTVVDAWGNTSTVAVTGGRVVVPVREIPTYVRLPTGVGVSVYSCKDWPPLAAPSFGVNSAPQAVAATHARINDGALRTFYDQQQREVYLSPGSPPDAVQLSFRTATRFDRAVIFTGCGWQNESTLVDFAVQTSNDGSTWATQATVTKTTPTSFKHGTDWHNVGCQYETYWDEQWIFDVPLPTPVTAKYVRVYARATSYGGEPDAQAVAAGGQGDAAQHLCIAELMLLCDDNTRPQYVRA